ncbi:MmcQ/YjbR family DNA-binding protein [Levilactobacillus tongjiangensis]|uniref:MmcQ/YjbR family DNA-binding protein n=1 Tax=Levilactobacillus tongjiangensis TaxID=2486023 RepID=A0ABW1ST37_9LACO|nr:MmcQ/YjbR family DNA-binding protein [Levilactobacillus tongjiangensis]
MVTRQDIFTYTEDNFGITPVYPFKSFPKYAVLKNRQGKWFGLIMNVSQSKLGLPGTDELDILDVKVDPELASILRDKPGYLAGYHMNKEHWISIILNQATDAHSLFQLLDGSYELVTNK